MRLYPINGIYFRINIFFVAEKSPASILHYWAKSLILREFDKSEKCNTFLRDRVNPNIKDTFFSQNITSREKNILSANDLQL